MCIKHKDIQVYKSQTTTAYINNDTHTGGVGSFNTPLSKGQAI